MATVPIIFEQGQSQPNTNTEQANNPSEETSTTQNPSTAIAEHLRKISEQGKRIQDIESTLELEKQQLAKEVAALNKIVEDQEKAMMSYFNSIKQTIADLTPNAKNKPPTDTTAQQKNDDQQPKENEN